MTIEQRHTINRPSIRSANTWILAVGLSSRRVLSSSWLIGHSAFSYPASMKDIVTATSGRKHVKYVQWGLCDSLTKTPHHNATADHFNHNKLWGRQSQYAPPPASWPLTFWPWKWCPSHVWRVYLCANFSLPRPLCSRLRPDVRDRQMSDAHHRLMPLPQGRGHNNSSFYTELTWTSIHRTALCWHLALLFS